MFQLFRISAFPFLISMNLSRRRYCDEKPRLSKPPDLRLPISEHPASETGIRFYAYRRSRRLRLKADLPCPPGTARQRKLRSHLPLILNRRGPSLSASSKSWNGSPPANVI